MTCTIKTISLIGMKGFVVNIEVDTERGLPAFIMVGLAELAVKESKERVRAAIKNSGFEIPVKKTIINFAPADIKKEGTHLDLAISIGILVSNGIIYHRNYTNIVFIGELSLNGEIRPVKGILPMVLEAKEHGIQTIIIPFENRSEVDFIEGIHIYCAAFLEDVVYFLNNEGTLYKNEKKARISTESFIHDVNLNEVKGQKIAKRAIEIAATGLHNVMMVGPPGSGKTMIAQRIPTIFPELTLKESIEVTKIYSVAGLLLDNNKMIMSSPFRNPHHSASTISIIGGGATPVPGEISLAHNGVLFLDEFLEHKRTTIESLRQPMEDGIVCISRIKGKYQYPCNFMLVASMNPCPCGNYGNELKECICTSTQIQNYLAKLSGPILDRIDLHLTVDPVKFSDLNNTIEEESSEEIKERVRKSRMIQLERFDGESINYNSQMKTKHIKKHCKLNEKSMLLLENAFTKLMSSTRAYNKVLKISRTLADMSESRNIEEDHIAEALQYRLFDRRYWGA